MMNVNRGGKFIKFVNPASGIKLQGEGNIPGCLFKKQPGFK